MIKLNGRDCYFVIPESKYGLSDVVPKYVTENDFTFAVRCKPAWDKMREGTYSQEGGLVIKNGMHMGISCFVNDGNRYFKCTLWVKDRKEKIECIEHHFIVSHEEKDKEYFITFRHNFKEKRMVIGNYDFFREKTYKGASPIDYSGSWLWVGAANAFNSCDDAHKHYYRGEISFVGVYGRYLSDEEIKKVYDNSQSVWHQKQLQDETTVLFSNLQTTTPYKIYDDSDNGNHLILYDEAWLKD